MAVVSWTWTRSLDGTSLLSKSWLGQGPAERCHLAQLRNCRLREGKSRCSLFTGKFCSHGIHACPCRELLILIAQFGNLQEDIDPIAF